MNDLTPAAARRDQRRDYRHFPPAYTELLERFEAGGQDTIHLGVMSKREAQGAVRDLYRFKMFILDAINEDPDDDHARRLSTIFSSVTLRVETLAEAKSDDATHCVVVTLNPVAAALKGLAAS